jgi:hypothetical protein
MGSTKYGVFLDQLSDYQPVKKYTLLSMVSYFPTYEYKLLVACFPFLHNFELSDFQFVLLSKY